MNYHLFEHNKFNLNFLYSEQDLEDFVELWNGGISAENIAKQMKRQPLEIALLVMDRAELGLIKKRATGLGGL